MGSRWERPSRASIVGTFGPDFANSVLGMEPGEWHGPIESAQGIHFVRVLERHPPATPSFDDLEYYLRQEWQFEKMRESQLKKIEALREKYTVMVE